MGDGDDGGVRYKECGEAAGYALYRCLDCGLVLTGDDLEVTFAYHDRIHVVGRGTNESLLLFRGRHPGRTRQ